MNMIVVPIIGIIALALIVRYITSRRNGDRRLNASFSSRKNRSRFDLAAAPIDDLDLNEGGELSPDADPLFTSPEPASKMPSRQDKPNPLVVFHLLANESAAYNGYELLQALLAAEMRFGDRQIFHRFDSVGSGANILFSATSINKPGTFELSKMNAFSCDGLILFCELDRVDAPSYVLDEMIQAATSITAALGGSILDENRSPITEATLDELRSRSVRFEPEVSADCVNG